ncbi:hypothetical protein A2Y83_02615 [Candidatus Falkowbacteria bacterium RBG_13_39_14]|uniref:Uncharacterized protein n=1 Tax=Candidatus Falkowbacteria bacterium RBG_13_39_14 TaxID=1797985 RepID=A0A1F5S5Q6_9BACT|nr:MAG: hypothetical protein A2Y83_02615 [Candidatus Falkowbacteria bacterium RBG_13_39_14]
MPYKTKSAKFSGTSLKDAGKNARRIYNKVIVNTKRKPFVRSAYFKNEKIFFDYFWDHLKQKGPKARFKRLQFFEAAVELIKNSKAAPALDRRSDKNEILYRFEGIIKNSNEKFYVQIKENKKNGNKYFMSCFPDQ